MLDNKNKTIVLTSPNYFPSPISISLIHQHKLYLDLLGELPVRAITGLTIHNINSSKPGSAIISHESPLIFRAEYSFHISITSIIRKCTINNISICWRNRYLYSTNLSHYIVRSSKVVM